MAFSDFKASFYKNNHSSSKVTNFQLDTSVARGICVDMSKPDFSMGGYYFEDKEDMVTNHYSIEIDVVSHHVYTSEKGIILINSTSTPRKKSMAEIESLKALYQFIGTDKEITNNDDEHIGSILSSIKAFRDTIKFMQSDEFESVCVLPIQSVYFLLNADSEDSHLLLNENAVDDVLVMSDWTAPNDNKFLIFKLNI